MEAERIFSADQIEVHPELAQLLKEYTKEVIRTNPEDLLSFSVDYFKKKAEDELDVKGNVHVGISSFFSSK
eukprot:gene325-587_t